MIIFVLGVLVILPVVLAKPMDEIIPLELDQLPEIVKREDWNARPATSTQTLTTPTPYVIIHHSYQPASCTTRNQCIEAMHWMQDFHQLTHKWFDIGYNFAIGGDGRVYEGRGWNLIGAHAPKYNNQSIGICLIGDWSHQLPPLKQLNAAKWLINYGVDNNFISANYILYGHRQVRETECPGQRLFDEITKWDHFNDNNV